MKNHRLAVSGISGRFPEADNVNEFWDNLINGVDMVTSHNMRWPPNYFNLPLRSGTIKDLTRFDAEFFGLSAKQASATGAVERMLFEVVYEAIADSGINPESLRGSRTGVYVGVTFKDIDEGFVGDRPDHAICLNFSTFPFSNTMSWSFDFEGPSITMDAACSSSLSAFAVAMADIRSGTCDRAIVAAINPTVDTNKSVWLNEFKTLSPDGACKHLDASANGFARAEAVVAVLVEPLHNAKRVYGELVHVVNGHNGSKDGGILAPSAEAQKDLLTKAYSDMKIDPKDVVFFECHGTGTAAGDKAEAMAIADIMLEGRQEPLLIGSIKSNVGHTEAAAGHCSLIKMLLAGEHSVIPANLHFNNPNPEIDCLNDQRIKVVDHNAKFNGGLIGLSSYGIGGSTAHSIIRISPEPSVKLDNQINLEIPRLIPICGRNEDSVTHIINYIKEHRDLLTEDFVALLTNYSKSTPGKGLNSRATITISKDSDDSEVLKAAQANEVIKDRPVWLVLSGMGCQWPAMARGLMDLPFFAKSIKSCAEVLKTVGVNLIDTLLDENKNALDIVFAPVGIAAIQVAIIDLLKKLKVRIDGIIGFSIGEITAAYADGCLDLEQTMLASYYRGKCLADATLTPGLMAAVGLTWEQALEQCPSDVIPACHIGQTSVTISGPKEKVMKFVGELSSKNVFAQAVETNEIAFHHPYLKTASIEMLKKLHQVIPNPKERSAKWLSTSLRDDQIGSEFSAKASGDYIVNNLLNPVFFHNTLKQVPNDAIVIDVGPHGLFKSAISKTLGSDAVYSSFMKRNSSRQGNIESIFNALSHLYLNGVNQDFENLYPVVNYPVAKGTPSISSLIKWDHSEQWPIDCYPNQYNPDSASDYAVEIDLNNLAYSYLTGHMIDGKCIFPATGYVRLVWEAMARSRGSKPEDISVTVEDVVLERATIITADRTTRLAVRLNSVSGHATVLDGSDLVMSARIKINEKELNEDLIEVVSSGKNLLSSLETYKEMRCRGYDYDGLFKSIDELDLDGNQALVKWQDNWIPFMDNFLQVLLIQNSAYRDDRKLHLPSRIRKVVINPIDFNPIPQSLIRVKYNEKTNVVRSDRVQIHGLSVSPMERLNVSKAVIEAIRFEPYIGSGSSSSFKCYLQECDIEIVRIIEGFKSQRTGLESGLLGILANLEFSGGDFRSADDLLIATFAENQEKIKQDLDGQLLSDDGLIRQIIDVVVENSSHNYRLFDGTKNHLSSEILERVKSNITSSKVVEETDEGHDFVIVVDEYVEDKVLGELFEQKSSRLNVNGFLAVVITEKLSLVEEYLNPMIKSRGWKKTELVRQSAVDLGLSLICDKFDGLSKRVLLFRKINQNQREQNFIDLTSSNWNWIEDAKKQLAKSQGTVWFVSANEPDNGIIGFINCIRKEPGGERARCLFAPGHEQFDEKEFQSIINDDLVTNCVVSGRNGRFTRNKFPEVLPIKTSNPVSVAMRTVGDLSSLYWQESPEKPSGVDTVDVHFVALNFRDVLTAMGRIQFADHKLKTLVLEYSGIHTNGDRVMGINGRSLSTKTNVGDNHLVWKVPGNWSLEEAATVPTVYLTVIYGMIYRGQIQKGESILIHAGAGGVGQAAIIIAQHFECQIYTTVGSQEKRNFLIKTFGLKNEQIFNSRELSFEADLMEATNGRGVDMVLNSLADEMLQASLRCLARDGRFIEIGKADVLKNSNIGMAMFDKGASVISVMADQLVYKMTKESNLFLTALIQEYIDSGIVKPINKTVFKSDQIEDAFRFMATGRHIGKILIETNSELKERVAYPSIAFYPDKVYVLIGGLGGFGLELMFWMSKRGAKKFVVTSRSGVSTSFQEFSLNRLKSQGVEVTICKLDVSKKLDAEMLFDVADQLGPVGGIFNMALVLNDGLFENLTKENFERVCAAKVDGTKNLDQLSRICKQLDYFVCFSSVVAGFGNSGQTNYGYANSVMDRVCENRRKEHLHGLSIQWGAIGDVGVLSDTDLKVKGFGLQRINTCLDKLEECLKSNESVVTSFLPDDSIEESKKGLVASSPVEKIAHLLGARNATSIKENANLEALGMNSLMAIEVKQVLSDNGQSAWSLSDIRQFTFAKIKTLFN